MLHSEDHLFPSFFQHLSGIEWGLNPYSWNLPLIRMVKEDTLLTFWHWEPVSWKIIFPPPWTREWRGWFGDDSSALHFCALYVYYYFTSSTSDHQASEPGGALLYVKEKPRARPEAAQFPIFYFPTFPSEIQEEKMLIHRNFERFKCSSRYVTNNRCDIFICKWNVYM